MRFLVNENVTGTVIRELRQRGHDVLSVKEEKRGRSSFSHSPRKMAWASGGIRSLNSCDIRVMHKVLPKTSNSERSILEITKSPCVRLPLNRVCCANSRSCLRGTRFAVVMDYVLHATSSNPALPKIPISDRFGGITGNRLVTHAKRRLGSGYRRARIGDN